MCVVHQLHALTCITLEAVCAARKKLAVIDPPVCSRACGLAEIGAPRHCPASVVEACSFSVSIMRYACLCRRGPSPFMTTPMGYNASPSTYSTSTQQFGLSQNLTAPWVQPHQHQVQARAYSASLLTNGPTGNEWVPSHFICTEFDPGLCRHGPMIHKDTKVCPQGPSTNAWQVVLLQDKSYRVVPDWAVSPIVPTIPDFLCPPPPVPSVPPPPFPQQPHRSALALGSYCPPRERVAATAAAQQLCPFEAASEAESGPGVQPVNPHFRSLPYTDCADKNIHSPVVSPVGDSAAAAGGATAVDGPYSHVPEGRTDSIE